MIVATKALVVGGSAWYMDAFLNRIVGDRPVLAEFTAVVELRLCI